MNPEQQTVSPEKFEAAAGYNFTVWQYLLKCKIEHYDYGSGTVISVGKKRSIFLTIRFDNINLIAIDKEFTIAGFSRYFKTIIMPKTKYDKLINYLKAQIARQNAKKQKSKPEAPAKPQAPQQSTTPINKPKPKSIPKPNDNGQQPKSSIANNQGSNHEAKCPFCQWKDLRVKLPVHISFIHPKKYPAWLRGNLTDQKPERGPKEKAGKTSGQNVDPNNVKCPICAQMMYKGSYPKHLKKDHPGKTIYTHPPLPVYIKPLTTVTSIRRAAGGVKQPIAMSTLNVGRRSKGYIKRK